MQANEYCVLNIGHSVHIERVQTYTAKALHHRYQKTKNRFLKVCYVPASSTRPPGLLFSFFVWPLTLLMIQTRQVGCTIKQSIFLDFYALHVTDIEIVVNLERECLYAQY